MNQKFAFLVSGVLTAFVLVIGGGLAGRLSQSAAAPAPVAAATQSAPAPSIDPASQVIAQLQDREVAYQQLIDQANQRLAAMNQQLAVAQAAQAAQAARTRAAAPAAPAPAAAQSAAPQITLSPDAARDIAVQAANFATMIRAPELVRFEGKVAYEVGFTRGVIYVDANTGAVLYNGTVGGSGSQPNLPGGEHETEPEHEAESHD